MNMNDLAYLALSAALTFVMLVAASLVRARAWTRAGIVAVFGNRDGVVEPSPVAGRVDRAARNMLENLALFTALLVAARFSGAGAAELTVGAAIFFWARVVYFGLYLGGVAYVRTAVWAVSVLGLAMIAKEVFVR
jgi:uncharacterized MAPEG superfamily protein